jgi:hypothetical protein
MDTVLERLAKRVGRKETDGDFQQAWASLQVESSYVAEDLTTVGEFDDCARQIRQRLAARTLRGKPGKAPAWIRHAFVLADHAAEASNQDPAVRAFRADILHGTLLQPSDVPVWLRARARQAPDTLAVDFATLLEFQEDGHLARIYVSGSAVLEHLHALVRQLLTQHGWPEDTATTFVLTGHTPLRWPVRARVLYRRDQASSIVTLAVDPWVPATAVTAAYLRARRLLASPDRRAPRVTARRRALAVFTAAHRNLTVRARLSAWNAAHPHWRFRGVQNFSRDSRRAVARLG